jgi:hypothetical protein
LVSTATSGSIFSLDHDPLAASPAGVGAGVAQLSADHVSGIEPRSAQGVHDHRRSCRLAVCAGHGHAAPQRRDLREQVRPVKLSALRGQPLGIVRRHGRGVHDLGARGDVGRGVPDREFDPVLAQPLGIAGLGAI